MNGFEASRREHPARPALEVGGSVLTFAELGREATRVAATLDAHSPGDGPALTAVYAHRSKTAFSGILAALLRGHGFVPLNPMYPPERTRVMLARSGCRAVVVDRQSASQLPDVLEGLDRALVVLLPEEADVESLSRRFPHHKFAGADGLEEVDELDPPAVDEDSIAYLLFTSGSTGTPKGVGVAQRNIRAFLDYVVPLYDVRPTDRFSQTADTTFDLSLFDIFVAWERAACVCCPSGEQLRRPDTFIEESGLTIWVSVPSAAIVMRRLGMLRPGRFRSLRLSVFCGEPLPSDIATAWAAAAPRSVLENLYGPTELTIACTRYRWSETSSREAHLGLVPIGTPFAAMEPLVVDEELRSVRPDEPGELLMTGPQMTPGYWDDPGRTAEAYVIPPGERRRYYRTGDRVDRERPEGPLRYLGRVDHQIKIRGHRVELGEVEAIVREESGSHGVAAVGWPRTASGASALDVFVEGDVEPEGLRGRVATRLPEYMVPRRIHMLDRLPLNANGKIDRNALLTLLEASG